MGLMVFTGGARSGKSRAAQDVAARCAGDVCVAVFGQAEDDEMAERIEKHREARPEGWDVVEATDSVEWTRRITGDVLVVDCLGTMLGMVMGETLAEMSSDELTGVATLPEGFEAEVERRFAALVGWLVRRSEHTVVVTNEVGDGVVPAYATGRVFRDVLGRANRALVDRADRAYLVVAGRLVSLHELPDHATWPWHEKGCD